MTREQIIDRIEEIIAASDAPEGDWVGCAAALDRAGGLEALARMLVRHAEVDDGNGLLTRGAWEQDIDALADAGLDADCDDREAVDAAWDAAYPDA
jgi:hypothetical protein